MVAKALVWLGTRTRHIDEMRAFYRGLFGSDPAVTTPELVVFDLPSGDRVELIATEEPHHHHFTTGPVAGFLVDDLETATRHIEALGAELLGPASAESGDVTWMHFRAPDGNVYEITQRTSHRARRPEDLGLPPLAAEDFTCAICGIDYLAVDVDTALKAIEQQPAQLRATAMAVPDRLLRTRPDTGTWSALEYLCHVRDVFAASTVRLYRIRTEDHPLLEPLFNDLRAVRFSYQNRDLLPILDELTDNARGFCDEARRTSEDEWSRQASRLPGEVRTARWLLRQTMHEGLHHERDIRAVVARAAARE
jgi:hypothetical protein